MVEVAAVTAACSLICNFKYIENITCPLGGLGITFEPKVPLVLGEEASGSDADKFSAG